MANLKTCNCSDKGKHADVAHHSVYCQYAIMSAGQGEITEIRNVVRKRSGKFVITYSEGNGSRVLIVSPQEIVENHKAAQQRMQPDVCPVCLGKGFLGTDFMPRKCDDCGGTGKRS
jgi:hypothetical protein